MESNFGTTLADLVLENNISLKKLSEDLGISLTTLYRWKANQEGIELSNLLALCRYFNCSLDYLVGKSDNNNRPTKIKVENFGKQVRKIMKAKGISSYTLRKDTRYTSAYFGAWDKGSDPKLSTLIELSDYFRCSLDELVGLE